MWLDEHATAPAARPVLASLLDHPTLGDRRTHVVARALECLRRHNNAYHAAKVLNAMAAHLDEPTPTDLVSDVMAWIQAMSPPKADGRTQFRERSGRVRWRRGRARGRAPVCGRAGAVAVHAPPRGTANQAMLHVSDGDTDEIGFAFDWLRARSDDYRASFLLRELLDRFDQVAAQAALLDMPARRPDRYGSSADAGFVLRGLVSARAGQHGSGRRCNRTSCLLRPADVRVREGANSCACPGQRLCLPSSSRWEAVSPVARYAQGRLRRCPLRGRLGRADADAGLLHLLLRNRTGRGQRCAHRVPDSGQSTGRGGV